MYEKLKPCPFCGGEARIGGIQVCQVGCARGAECLAISKPNNPQEAVDKWNRRDTEDALRSRLHALNGIVDAALNGLRNIEPTTAANLDAAREGVMRDE